LELLDLKTDYLETKQQLKEASIIYLDCTTISRISALKPTPSSLTSTKLGPTFAMSKDGCLVFSKVSDSEKEPLLEAAMASPTSMTMQFKCNDCECLTPHYLTTDLFCISPEALHNPKLESSDPQATTCSPRPRLGGGSVRIFPELGVSLVQGKD
ncbi:hypothetical protein L0F63_006725, partial [Massospora cicadina]